MYCSVQVITRCYAAPFNTSCYSDQNINTWPSGVTMVNRSVAPSNSTIVTLHGIAKPLYWDLMLVETPPSSFPTKIS